MHTQAQLHMHAYKRVPVHTCKRSRVAKEGD